jgi:hypothetical protein
MENQKATQTGFVDIFFNKLKEQSFTIILMVGILVYQNQLFEAELARCEKLLDQKDAKIDQLTDMIIKKSTEREAYLNQQRDSYVQDLLNDRR